MTVVKSLRIGVDVGGTNTDAVILDLTPGSSQPVLSSCKAPTTPDVTLGIQMAVQGCLKKASIDKSRLQAVAIGTTSFVNSLIERNAKKLERVAVIRLCGPFSRLTPPFVAFPYELRAVLEGPVFFAEGGLQVDGREISQVDVAEIRGICEEIKRQGIKTVAVSAVYSPIDGTIKQEETVRAIIKAELPDVKVTISKEVANLGLLERENATILNAALLSFASLTVAGFEDSTRALQLDCPLFLTSNDGTLMTCEQAARFPIKTFSSGPTNSMRGANFLARLASGGSRKETALVVDVGGTTTEIGVLLPTGFPRQAAAHHELCGVPLNFSMPHVHSFGLGGGSRVRKDGTGKLTIGPDSVGYEIQQSLSFGGKVFTATDVAVALGKAKGVGDPSLVTDLDRADVEAAEARMKVMIELAIDAMKTNTQDVPVYLVGGGAILVPDSLKGVSNVHRFPFYDAANAVGAACAEVSAVVDTFEDTSKLSVGQVQKLVEQRTIDKAIANGASAETCKVVESEAIPIAYTSGRCRFYVKAAGEWTGAGSIAASSAEESAGLIPSNGHSSEALTPIEPVNLKRKLPTVDNILQAADMLAYKPNVSNGEWSLSETDLEWIATGCYILGCGGGGSPQHDFLALREMVRRGETCKVIDLSAMSADGEIIWGGGIGSPEVSSERLMGEEYNEAVQELISFMNLKKVTALAALEIGGGNGMINMISGASSYFNLPVIDGDFMGRAYPTGWQTTPNVYDTGNKGELLLPASMSSGDGSVVFITKAKHYREVDSILRAGCVEMGTHAGSACRPLNKEQCEVMMIKNTISQAWRLGRAVALANKQAQIGNIGPILVDALGGSSTAKVLFHGKIVAVKRTMYKGHTVGELVIQALAVEEEEDSDEDASTKLRFQGQMTIPFKNENLFCKHTVDGESKIVAGVPDLIAVLDSQNGSALGTPDYKYGLRVLVLGVTAAPQWTDTPRGLEIGALPAFGYDIPYEPLGKYVKPRSVIEEYS
ncbi:putative hydantoinase [Naematelia encephala]|uniref:Putative hydantoinase n=1 Tax=Naematelia encephala TaxID=71784 RepID=A0A1Y2B7G2_9TREE|nr:putative hydantoinase [Naematelia encephala]